MINNLNIVFTYVVWLFHYAVVTLIGANTTSQEVHSGSCHNLKAFIIVIS